MRKHIWREATKKELEDMPNEHLIEIRWSDDKTTTQIVGLEGLPEIMLKRLATDIFDQMPKTKMKVWFL